MFTLVILSTAAPPIYACAAPITWGKTSCVLANDPTSEEALTSTPTAISAVVVTKNSFAEKTIFRDDMRNSTSMKDGIPFALLMEKTGKREVIKGCDVVVSNVNSSGMEANYKGDIFGRQEMNVAWETLVRGSTPVMPGNDVRGDFAIISQVKAPIYATITQIRARSSNLALVMEKNAVRCSTITTNSDAFLKCIAMHDMIRVQIDSMKSTKSTSSPASCA